MANLRGKALYSAALERLKSGDAEVVDTSSADFRFSTTTVAIEAGKKKGFIRFDRYPDLCMEIKAAEESRKLKLSGQSKKNKNTTNERIKRLSEQYSDLKKQHEDCLEKMLNLIRLNYELQKENKLLKSSGIHKVS